MGLNDKHVLLLGVIVFFIAIAGSLVFGENIDKSSEIEGGTLDWSNPPIREAVSVTGYADEGVENSMSVSIEEVNVAEVTFVLTWFDETDADGRHENEPDEFSIMAVGPYGTEFRGGPAVNTHGGQGTITFSAFLFDNEHPPTTMPFLNGTGKWSITITVNAGDQVFWRPSLVDQDLSDNGNDYSLDVEYEYYAPIGEGDR